MRWAYRIGRVAGTDIKVHATFVLLIAWWGYAGYSEGGPQAAIASALMLIALFTCVVLHEFGHILMARRFGVRTPDVILLPIGGVARLERIPDEPRQELLIALAGPAVTLGIIAALDAYLRLTGAGPVGWTIRADESLPGTLLKINRYLLLFNLIPAFPMDGGRVLRAVLASRLGLLRGTRIAASLGQMLAVAGGLYGVFYGAPMLALVAFFIFLGARSEAAAVETRVAGMGLTVAQMMVTNVRTVPVHASLGHAADLLLAGEQREFPVVDNFGRIEGLLTRDNLVRGLSQLGAQATVAEAMTADAPSVTPAATFREAIERLHASGLPALLVVDANGALVGLLTKDSIHNVLLVQRSRAAAASHIPKP